jgi:bacterial/archaeal transporter family-2 protein
MNKTLLGSEINMILGLLFALIAGSLLSIQNIFNSIVNERAGSWATTTLVLGMGFLASMGIGLIFEGGNMFDLENMKPWYWFSGLLGVGVVTCLVQGMRLLGPTYAIAIVLTAQLGFALIFDSFGWLGMEMVPFTFKQVMGVLVIIVGILVFKFGGARENQEVSKVENMAG